MVVRFPLPGHGLPCRPPHRIRVVLVLHANPPAQRRVVECRHVAGRVDIGMARAEGFIDNDAVPDLQPRGAGHLRVRLDPQSGHHPVHDHLPAALRLQHGLRPVLLQPDDPLSGPHVHALLPVETVEEHRKIARIAAAADPFIGEQHHDVLVVHGQRRRDLRADEPAADDGKLPALLGERAEARVVVERPEVNDAIASKTETPGNAARRQEQLLPRVDRPLIVGDLLSPGVERHGRPPEVEIDPPAVRAAPDGVQRFSLPQGLGEGRAVVRRVRVGPDEPDGSRRIRLANPPDRGIGGHAPADNEVFDPRRLRHHRPPVDRYAVTPRVPVRRGLHLRPGDWREPGPARLQ